MNQLVEYDNAEDVEQLELLNCQNEQLFMTNMQSSLVIAAQPIQEIGMPHFQMYNLDIQSQLNLLMERQQQLAVFILSRERRMKTVKEQYQHRPNCLEFYRTLNIRLEEYFQGLKVIASGLVSHEMVDTKMLIATGCKIAEKVTHGIPIVGGAVAFFFGIGHEAIEHAMYFQYEHCETYFRACDLSRIYYQC